MVPSYSCIELLPLTPIHGAISSYFRECYPCSALRNSAKSLHIRSIHAITSIGPSLCIAANTLPSWLPLNINYSEKKLTYIRTLRCLSWASRCQHNLCSLWTEAPPMGQSLNYFWPWPWRKAAVAGARKGEREGRADRERERHLADCIGRIWISKLTYLAILFQIYSDWIGEP